MKPDQPNQPSQDDKVKRNATDTKPKRKKTRQRPPAKLANNKAAPPDEPIGYTRNQKFALGGAACVAGLGAAAFYSLRYHVAPANEVLVRRVVPLARVT